MGAALDKSYEKYGLTFMRSLSCQTPMMMIGSIEAAVNFECIPKQLKHITSGIIYEIKDCSFPFSSCCFSTSMWSWALGMTTCCSGE